MNLNRRWLSYILPAALLAAGATGCVPLEHAASPTLHDVRVGATRGYEARDTALQTGELQGEVAQIDRSRREIVVITDTGRSHALPYDFERTTVLYHGRQYGIEDLQAGDRIAYRPGRRDIRYLDTIRILEPVQARLTPGLAERAPSYRPRADVRRAEIVEGRIETIDHDLGLFELRPRAGRAVVVSLPYNARAADVDYFHGLRRGDHVMVEGEFVNPENFQLLAFRSPR